MIADHHRVLYLILFCIVGGQIIGYDIATSGELTSSLIPFLKEPSPFSLTAFTSSFYVAALLSYSLLIGRKTPLLLGWIIIIIAGVVTSSSAQHLCVLIVGRILYGIGVGFSVKSLQVYGAPHIFLRDPISRMVIGHMPIAMGIFMAHLVSSEIMDHLDECSRWRVRLGFACVPAISAIGYHLLFNLSFGLPFAPEEEEEEEEIKVGESSTRAANIKPRDYLAEEVDEELAVPSLKQKEGREQSPWVRPRYYYLVAALTVPLLMQKLTGVNLVVMFYLPVLFHAIFVGSDACLLCSVVINVALALVLPIPI